MIKMAELFDIDICPKCGADLENLGLDHEVWDEQYWNVKCTECDFKGWAKLSLELVAFYEDTGKGKFILIEEV